MHGRWSMVFKPSREQAVVNFRRGLDRCDHRFIMSAHHPPGWRNWQTRYLEVVVLTRSAGSSPVPGIAAAGESTSPAARVSCYARDFHARPLTAKRGHPEYPSQPGGPWNNAGGIFWISPFCFVPFCFVDRTSSPTTSRSNRPAQLAPRRVWGRALSLSTQPAAGDCDPESS